MNKADLAVDFAIEDGAFEADIRDPRRSGFQDFDRARRSCECEGHRNHRRHDSKTRTLEVDASR